MSDVQTENAAFVAPAPGLENAEHTPATLVDPNAPLPAAVATAAAIIEGDTGPLDLAYVRAELDAVLFGIRSGVSNGIERVQSLIRHVESKL